MTNPSHVIEMASLILLCVPGQCGDNCPAVQTSSLIGGTFENLQILSGTLEWKTIWLVQKS